MNYSQDTTPGASDVPLQPARLPATEPVLFPSQNIQCGWIQSPNAFFSITPRCRHGLVFASPPKSCGERRIRAVWRGGNYAQAVWRGRRRASPFGKAIRRSTFTRLTFTCLRAVNKNLPAPPWTSLHGGDAGGGGGRRCSGATVNLGKCVLCGIGHAAGDGVLVPAFARVV